jgi:hypothetical protein
MKPTKLIWFVLMMAVASYCWLSVPSVQPTRINNVDTPDNSQQTFLLGPTTSTITGILTDPEFRAVIRALEQRADGHKLAPPKVTTRRSSRHRNIYDGEFTFVLTNK